MWSFQFISLFLFVLGIIILFKNLTPCLALRIALHHQFLFPFQSFHLFYLTSPFFFSPFLYSQPFLLPSSLPLYLSSFLPYLLSFLHLISFFFFFHWFFFIYGLTNFYPSQPLHTYFSSTGWIELARNPPPPTNKPPAMEMHPSFPSEPSPNMTPLIRRTTTCTETLESDSQTQRLDTRTPLNTDSKSLPGREVEGGKV